MLQLTANERVYSSIAVASLPFKYWSGGIEYAFVFVVSKYHTGRVYISYDPNGTNHPATPSNEVYNSIVDVSSQTIAFETVGWSQTVAYKEVGPNTLTLFSPLGTIYNSTLANGSLRVTVANTLRGPDPTVPVQILMYARAAVDFEVFCPNPDFDFSTDGPFPDPLVELVEIPEFEVASGAYSVNELAGSISPTATSVKPIVYAGEKITSYRSLVHRYDWHHQINYDSTATAAGQPLLWTMCLPMYPCPNGDVSGDVTLEAWADVLRTNPVRTHLMTWLRMFYGGWRGSIRYKMVPSQATQVQLGAVSVNRLPLPSPWNRNSTSTFLYSVEGVAINGKAQLPTSWGGGVLTQYENQQAVEFSIPFYSNLKFFQTPYNYFNNTEATAGILDKNADLAVAVSVQLIHQSATNGRAHADFYVGAGDDFDLLLYLGSPVFRRVTPV
jgi:hypothetical protein